MYIYSPHLMALDSCKLVQDKPWHGAEPLDHQFTLQVECWTKELNNHPNHYFTNYVLEGITNGFRIGFNHRHLLCSSIKNLSTGKKSGRDYLLPQAGSTTGQDAQTCCLPSRYPFNGAIPKKHKPEKWRLIMDLSSPAGSSINDGISSKWSSLSYVSIDYLLFLVLEAGKGSTLVKVDIKEAYRMLPIHPEDQGVLGTQW